MSRTRGKLVPAAEGGGCPLTNHPTTRATGLLSERCCCFISLSRLLCLLNLNLDLGIDLDIDIGVDLDFGLELDFHLDIGRDLGLFEAKAHCLNEGASRGDLIGQRFLLTSSPPVMKEMLSTTEGCLRVACIDFHGSTRCIDHCDNTAKLDPPLIDFSLLQQMRFFRR